MKRPLVALALASAVAASGSASAQTGAAPALTPSPSPPAAPSPSERAHTNATSANDAAPSSAPQSPPEPPSETPAPAAAPPATTPAPSTVESPDATASAPTPTSTLSVNKPAGTVTSTNADAPAQAWPPPLHGWQQGHGLGVEGTFRVGGRFGSANALSDSEEHAGLGFDLGLWLRLAEEYAFGFSVKRADLGAIALTQGEATLNAGYATTALELGGRAYPVRGRQAELFLGLRVGMAWQDVNATGLRPSLDLQPPQAFECSDVGGPNFALGAEVGGSWRLTHALWLTGNVGFDGYALSAGQVGNCVAGVGSTTALSVGGGLLYTFDLGGERRVAARTRPAPF